MILVFRLMMLVTIILLLLFSMSNLSPVTVHLLGWESPPMPLFLLLIFTFFFGFFLALVWQAWSGFNSGRNGYRHIRDAEPKKAASNGRRFTLRAKKKRDDTPAVKPKGEEVQDEEPAASADSAADAAGEGADSEQEEVAGPETETATDKTDTKS